MADDVSKKDLQGVEARCTKKIDGVKKDLEQLRKEWRADSEELNQIQVNIRHDLDKRCDAIEAQLKDLLNTVNQQTKLITELQNRKTSIF